MYNFHLSYDRVLYKCEVSIQWKPSNADTIETTAVGPDYIF